ncbi:MAG: MerR family transcriptional regulator [Kofleriaceae bacterium]|nr:MerR family transcriptional regulator [Kofleriaceae bacterium]MBP9171361.1 MerR family transcriptional regulator [Kofleriaceae bacterium]MBP9862824.1 MerR family transcriptional regulator [Kofleriaceae bacterium]
MSPWTIAELTARVAAALAEDAGPDNRRIRAVPDERAIRYYTTLGLLDRPALTGRTAFYGPRHLAQLVAIKRAQAAGQSLAEIQRDLPTLDDATLTARSGVALAPPSRPGHRRDFWRAPPPAPPPPVTAAPPPAAVAIRTEVELAPGVRISLALARPLTDADLAALTSAAAPLLAEAQRRHLLTSESPDDPDRD